MPDYCATTTPSAFLPMRSIAFCAKPEVFMSATKALAYSTTAFGAPCRHDDADAALIDFGNALDRRGRRHQECRPQADQHRPEIEGRGAILGDADERHVDLAALEQLDHVRRIADRYDLMRNTE